MYSKIKATLDIPRTLEVLETNGVGVYTVGENDDFPDFYLRNSGHRSPGGAVSISRAAEIIQISQELKLTSGMMMANPVPVEQEGDGKLISTFIDQAIRESEEQKITGAASTPFILGRLAELSKGKTVEINRHLVVNNAKTGGEIATALAEMKNSR